ncbi:MAG: HAD family phosphatase [Pseudomonadota bacterium]
MAVDAVVFDIGNVLIEWHPERFYDAEIGAERRKELFATVPLEKMNLEVDRGAPFRASVEALATAHPDWSVEIMLWHDRWIDMASPAIDESAVLLRALKKQGVSVFALSNFGIETFAFAETVYPILTEFDRRWISGHLGVIKPDPAIYQLLEDQSGVPADRLLFTDDRPDNISAAELRGWQTHLFEGPSGLSRRLVEEGFLERAP